MSDAFPTRSPAESRIEEEPILGPVLFLPDGRIQPLTWRERLMVRLHLTDARALEARYAAASNHQPVNA